VGARPTQQTEPLGRMPPTYLVEDLGNLPITYVAQQEIFGHQLGKLGVLPALLLGARVARVALS
jgi:hypothetical protein